MSGYSELDEVGIRDPGGKEILDKSSGVRPEFVGPVDEMDDRDLEHAQGFQEEQELIVSILERNEGKSHIRTIAKEMGMEPHELSIPLERLSQGGTITVTGSGIHSMVSLTRENSQE